MVLYGEKKKFPQWKKFLALPFQRVKKETKYFCLSIVKKDDDKEEDEDDDDDDDDGDDDDKLKDKYHRFDIPSAI